MKKIDLIELLRMYEDDDDINLNELARDIKEERLEKIEELEERQHQSGFYTFQDMMDMRRRER